MVWINSNSALKLELKLELAGAELGKKVVFTMFFFTFSLKILVPIVTESRVGVQGLSLKLSYWPVFMDLLLKYKI